jgi:hypothetical protein
MTERSNVSEKSTVAIFMINGLINLSQWEIKLQKKPGLDEVHHGTAFVITPKAECNKTIVQENIISLMLRTPCPVPLNSPFPSRQVVDCLHMAIVCMQYVRCPYSQ